MKQAAAFLSLVVLTTAACTYAGRDNTTDRGMAAKNRSIFACSDDCRAVNKSKLLQCKLTSPALQKRKETVLTSLKNQVIEKMELENGYSFKFPGSDKMLDELAEFIKTERACCDFFVYELSISGDKSEAWLVLTGPEGVKDFILSELDM